MIRILNWDKQIEYSGEAYIDPRQMPVDKIEDLNDVKAFDGMSVTVINDETNNEPTRYIYTEKDDESNGSWQIDGPIIEQITEDDFE